MKYLIVIIASFLMVGCVTTHNGIIQPSNVQLNNTNFKYIKTIDGFASASYFLGIGLNNRDGLVKEAKDQMYYNHSFKQNQSITNITLDEKTSWVFPPLVYEKTVIISADIVQFGEELEEDLKESNSENTSINKNKKDIKEIIKVSNDESIIDELSKSKDLELLNYNSIDEVINGDFVKVNNSYNQIVFGKVVGKSPGKMVKVKLFPSIGTEIIEEYSFKRLLKVKD